MGDNVCSTQGCPIQACLGKMLFTAFPVFLFLFAAGYLTHHVWLMPIYEQTASLWRPKEEMAQNFSLLLLYYALLSVVISALFCKLKKAKMESCATNEADCKIGGKNCPIKCGACFGLTIGLLMGIQCAGSYIWTPIPGELAVKWLVADVLQGVGIGIMLALICHCKKKGCATK